jgi:hypothetical protein
MTIPSEERAAKIVECVFADVNDIARMKEAITAAIREAVEAENTRCAQKMQETITCLLCGIAGKEPPPEANPLSRIEQLETQHKELFSWQADHAREHTSKGVGK